MDPGTGLRSIATVLFADICDFTAHCRGLPPEDAVALANKAGGIVVGKLGTATVSYEELFGVQADTGQS
jgi:bifunctional ADP-heptose synthase (sugar kinase/adenylyltransferase)